MADTSRDDVDKCRIEDNFFGTVTVGERGQVVIPAEARRVFSIETGDKLLVMGHPKKHGVILCKIDSLREFMTQMIEGLKIVESQVLESEPNVKDSATSATEEAAK